MLPEETQIADFRLRRQLKTQEAAFIFTLHVIVLLWMTVMGAGTRLLSCVNYLVDIHAGLTAIIELIHFILAHDKTRLFADSDLFTTALLPS